MIVNERTDFCTVSLRAGQMSNAAHAAYWTACMDGERGNSSLEFHERDIIETFQKLADVLGYRVEKIDDRIAEFAEALGEIEALAAREVAK